MTNDKATPRDLGRSAPRLLVIDFDYFFPNPMEAGDAGNGELGLYDWMHAESRLLRDIIWAHRAAAFFMNELELPRCVEHTGRQGIGYRDFWARFTIPADTPLWVADSNTFAGHLTADGRPAGRFEELWLFDAHHDAGYARTYAQFQRDRMITCEDWLFAHHARGTGIVMRYPTWRPWTRTGEPEPKISIDRGRDDGRPVPHRFDAVFACRSGSWVPAWCDDQWWEFVHAYPAGDLVEIEPGVFDQPRWNSALTEEARRRGAMHQSVANLVRDDGTP